MKATALLALSGLITVGLMAPLPSEARDPKSDDGHPGANGTSATGGRAVDCDAASVIMRALERLRPGETLFISGVCAQNVGVSKQDATIERKPPGATGAVIEAPSVPSP
jgi:hypothetical protein